VAARPALFPEPARQPPPLSRWLASPGWRLVPGEKARWTDLRTTTVDCQECAHLQHEQNGNFGPRRQAKRRRVTPLGARLNLCREHALAWKQRDEKDTAR